ncbi:MAG TPA: DUF5343 domain-containing protein [Thermoanaerobaculia bacterium]
MALQPVYLVAAKNLGKFLDALRHAQPPDKMNLKFVDELGFTSTNDRLFIPLLKAMRFVDDAGKPTSRYHAFLDDTEWKKVLADGIRDAYPDLFRVNRNAHLLSREQLTGKMKSLSEGKPSAAVLGNMVKTFVELVKLADFDAQAEEHIPTPQVEAVPPRMEDSELPAITFPRSEASGPTLVYRIEIVLPAVRDQAIYDAIFRSAKEHLLR